MQRGSCPICGARCQCRNRGADGTCCPCHKHKARTVKGKLIPVEHFTKNTVEAKLWCKKCYRMTMHRIDSGRQGPCLECMKREHANAIWLQQTAEEREAHNVQVANQRAGEQIKFLFRLEDEEKS